MGKPKALLQWRGLPFIEYVCASLRAAGVEDRVVVLGRASADILAAWTPSGETTAINPEPEKGQLSSLRAGLESANNNSEAYMVCLADQPTISPGTYKDLISFWRAHPDSIVIPRCERNAASGESQVKGPEQDLASHKSQGTSHKPEAAGVKKLQASADSPLATRHSPLSYKRGHPIIIPRKCLRLCFEGPLDKGLHWVTHHPSALLADLDVKDREIIRDFDTPEDYQRLIGK